jgi:hypothetical protein
MSTKYRKLMIVVSLIAALTMLATMTGVSSAAGGGGNNDKEETTCVVGYVINHREVPVDGTNELFIDENNPDDEGLFVEAVRGGMEDAAAAAAAPVEATAAMTATAPMTATEAVTAPVAAEAPVEAAPVEPLGSWVDEHGYFEIEDLAVGDWNFTMDLVDTDFAGIVPLADRNGVAKTGDTYLEERDEKHCHVVVFKIKREFDVTVLKWEEKLDGTVQPGKDWKITATPQGDPFAVKDDDETDASGMAVVTLTPGKWQIAEQVKKGWMPITPASVYLTLDQYAPIGAIDPVVFKNREPICYASIEVTKLGYSVDGTYLGPLAGWNVTLSRPDGKITPVTKTTDGSGRILFSKLTPGVYNVKEAVQPGWEVSGDNPVQVILRDCEEEYPVTFENFETVGELKIEGRKLFKAWEKPYAGHPGVGLSGWLITATLKGSDPEVLATTYTDAVGNYVFDSDTPDFDALQVPGATITVCEEKRDHWIPVGPTCVDVVFPYPVPPAYMGAKNVNFTNMQDPPPGAAPSLAAPSASASCGTTYVVQRGDTLSGIAAQYGTSASALAQANGIANPNLVRAGQTLCVQ